MNALLAWDMCWLWEKLLPNNSYLAIVTEWWKIARLVNPFTKIFFSTASNNFTQSCCFLS